MLSPPAPAERHLDGRRLREGIADRRRQLLDLEIAMVAACEAGAAHGRAPGAPIEDRETWDRATWTRYLAAAARLESHYGPPMRRLLVELDQLTRLTELPPGDETKR